jgi:hypothetical protein
MSTKKNIAPVTAIVKESDAPATIPTTPTTKVVENALNEATEASKLVPITRDKVNLLKHKPSAKSEKTATLSAEDKRKQKQDRYTANRAKRIAKLQAKKDAFILRIVEENKLDESFTKEMAESMWYNKHDAKNRALGGYATKVYDAEKKVWKKVDGAKWSLVAIKAKETLAKLRKERTIIETAVGVNGKQYTRKRVLKPDFSKTTKKWSLEEAKARFKAQDAARKVRFDTLPKKEVVLSEKKVKTNTEPKKETQNFKLVVRRQSSEKENEFYDFATIPFKGTLKAAEVRAADLFAKYEADTSFEGVVLSDDAGVKKVFTRKNQQLSNAA